MMFAKPTLANGRRIHLVWRPLRATNLGLGEETLKAGQQLIACARRQVDSFSRLFARDSQADR